MAFVILTMVGPDRPGIVRAAAAHVAAHGGSWLESRMARLAGQFVGIVRLDVPDRAAVASLGEALGALRADGIATVLMEGGAEAQPRAEPATHATVSLVGQDRPGIVRDLTATLAGLRVNIEELATRVESGSFSGEAMFHAEAQLRLPAPVSIADLREALETLGNEFMVDMQEGPGAAPGTPAP
ncbi:MAG: glycine cleavage system protein R [Acidisphaera sp.]|nr:glycine cleavage system protein R [Acidisphaera sp.]MBV9814099.1 glycine cleavage system protein R [Acetobacteraceae bacterium]